MFAAIRRAYPQKKIVRAGRRHALVADRILSLDVAVAAITRA
jgi:hypothetical protein